MPRNLIAQRGRQRARRSRFHITVVAVVVRPFSLRGRHREYRTSIGAQHF